MSNDLYLFYRSASPFSNFYPCGFEMEGINFRSSEQAFMWAKATIFGSTQIADMILAVNTPNEAKKLGRSRKIAFDEKVWAEHSYGIMVQVLKHKFNNVDLLEKLFATGNKTLVEASPYDKVWGIGLDKNDPRAYQPENWLGQNLLGKALMEVRDYYRELLNEY